VCRHLAYIGPRIALYDLLFGAPHSLCNQARSPRLQRSGEENPDGWGVGWYELGEPFPEQYRTVAKIWDDVEFAQRSHTIESGAFLGAARLASPGSTIEEAGNAPFRSEQWLFSLNGGIKGFRDGVGDELRAAVTPARRAAIEGDADSEVLFALALDRLDAGIPPGDALAGVMEHVLEVSSGRFNMLLTDGKHIVATRHGNSLFVRDRTVASEPLDDEPGWDEVAEGAILAL
jgi:glutamine amidotransferase